MSDPHANAAEDYADLLSAPGADDLTFGSLLDTMIADQFVRHKRTAGLMPREFTECRCCGGTDATRPPGQRPAQHHVEHKLDCLLAKHLPRLRAMANKGVT